MENLERIIAKILEEANEKAEFILSEANEKANMYAKNYELNTKKEIEKLNAEYEVLENAELEKLKSSIKLKTRNIILSAKQQAITNIFEVLNNEIKNIPSEKIKRYITRILEKRPLEINEYLILPSAYENMNLGLDNVKFSDGINTGFMIEKNGIFENYTFETLIQYTRDEIEVKIREYLFN